MFLLLCSAFLQAQTAEITPQILDSNLFIHMQLTDVDQQIIKETIQKGFSTQIHFELQLYYNEKGILRLFGGHLLESKSVIYVARYNPYLSSFEISVHTDHSDTVIDQMLFDSFDSFISSFFETTFEHFTIENTDLPDCTIRHRIRLYPIKQTKPFNIIHPYLLGNLYSTYWKKVEYQDLEQ